MRRRLRIPQLAAVMGPCIAGGAYLPALSDTIIMVEKVSFMGLGGPNLVKGAVGQVTDAESLGGAAMHTASSGVAHYSAKNDAEALQLIRRQFQPLPQPKQVPQGEAPDSKGLYEVLPSDHRLPYHMEEILSRILDPCGYLEFQPALAPEFLCATAELNGRPIAVIANRRGFLKTGAGPRVGGIVYTESAQKVAYFVEHAQRHSLPILYVQDVSGFMVGVEAEASGIIRAGAEMVESMACATVPKIVLTVNHASGAGYYAMAGQGFDPNFTFSWPTARIGVMEGDAAIQAVYGPELEKLKSQNKPVPDDLAARIEQTRADYDDWLDALHGAARGHCDAVIDPAESREVLSFAFEVACAADRTEHVPIQLLPYDPDR
jgi:acetyl-CoA carboxylase carboxyltransferase component